MSDEKLTLKEMCEAYEVCRPPFAHMARPARGNGNQVASEQLLTAPWLMLTPDRRPGPGGHRPRDGGRIYWDPYRG